MASQQRTNTQRTERFYFGGMPIVAVQQSNDEWMASVERAPQIFGKGKTMQMALGALMKCGMLYKTIYHPILGALDIELTHQQRLIDLHEKMPPGTPVRTVVDITEVMLDEGKGKPGKVVYPKGTRAYIVSYTLDPLYMLKMSFVGYESRPLKPEWVEEYVPD